MSYDWYAHQWPAQPLTLGADGLMPVGAIDGAGCCPDPLAVSFCTAACAMVDLLPNGPMWDAQKRDAVAYIQRSPDIGFCDTVVCVDPKCPTMADYAIYAAALHVENVNTIIWPSIRESDPATAVTTVQDWLDRYGWQDCYKSACRQVGIKTPFDVVGECGLSFCEPVYDAAFDAALKHAILQSVIRAKRGVIRNLEGLNWIVQPLGAAVRPSQPWPQVVQDYLDGDCVDDGPPCFCEEAKIEVYPATEFLPAAPGHFSNREPRGSPVPARQCDVAPLPVYPGVIAADCILRSIMTQKCPSILRACFGD